MAQSTSDIQMGVDRREIVLITNDGNHDEKAMVMDVVKVKGGESVEKSGIPMEQSRMGFTPPPSFSIPTYQTSLHKPPGMKMQPTRCSLLVYIY